MSCDSRQFYSELDIGVARPSPDELAAVPHHFIACRSVKNPYNVYTYEQEAIACIEKLFLSHDDVVAVGGSGLYIEALCHGVSVMPDPVPGLREQLQQQLRDEGVESLRQMLKLLDPDYYARVDLANGVRIQRALEVCLTTGRPYSQVIQQERPQRPFRIQYEVIERDRTELRQRIDQRVDQMMAAGLEQEARRLYPLRHLNTLNTVGYKEFFAVWDQTELQVSSTSVTDLRLKTPVSNPKFQVASAIKLNTWHYAKKQLTWLKKFIG